MRLRTGHYGQVEIFQDDSRIVDYQGPVGYVGTANYFKFGPYDYSRTQRSLFLIHYSRFKLRRFSPTS